MREAMNIVMGEEMSHNIIYSDLRIKQYNGIRGFL